MKSKTKYYINQNEIKRIFKQNNLGEVSNIANLESGEFNSAYFVSCKNKEYVIKIAPNNNEHLLTYEKDLMEREVDFYRSIAKQTKVKIPQIYAYCSMDKNINSSYFIMEKLTSKPLSNCKLSKDERIKVNLEIGKNLAELHTIKGDKFGYVQNGLHENWYEAIKAMVTNLVADCTRYGKKARLGKVLLSYIEKHKQILMNVNSTYVHFDLWDGNIFYKTVNGEIELTFIDTERGFWGDSIADFVNIEMFSKLEDKKSIDAYNKRADAQVNFTREENIRFNIMKAYLGLIVYTEKFARYKLFQFKYLINIIMSNYFFKQAFTALKSL